MKWISFATVAALALVPPLGSAAPARTHAEPADSDQMRPRHRTAQSASAVAAAATGAPTADDVGDADSFGRNVVYLGVAQTEQISLEPTCGPPDPSQGFRCIQLPPAPAPFPTSFNETGLAVINMPAKASKSLLCFNFTPFVTVTFENNTTTSQIAQLRLRGEIVIHNPVLDDPTLINTDTGEPFGGQILLTVSTGNETRSIAPGEFESRQINVTRSCVGGLISKSVLEATGLTEAQARAFFKNPMQISFGASGTVGSVTELGYSFGVRLYGD